MAANHQLEAMQGQAELIVARRAAALDFDLCGIP